MQLPNNSSEIEIISLKKKKKNTFQLWNKNNEFDYNKDLLTKIPDFNRFLIKITAIDMGTHSLQNAWRLVKPNDCPHMHTYTHTDTINDVML